MKRNDEVQTELLIRPEREADMTCISALTTAAFGQDLEARLIESLRHSAVPFISLVAEQAGILLGHISFSPMHLNPARKHLRLMSLAPLAVAETHQRRGIGGRLVAAGLEVCKSEGVDAVFVLGHPQYYPRFGFVKSDRWLLSQPDPVPVDAFMVCELTAGSLDCGGGTVHFHPSFALFENT